MFIFRAGGADSVDQNLVRGHTEAARQRVLEVGQARAAELIDLLAALAAEVVMMILARRLVARRLAGKRDLGDVPSLRSALMFR